MRASRGAMADTVPLAGDPLVITTTQDLEVAPLSVRGSATAPLHPRRQPRTQVTLNGKPRWNSQSTHERFCVTLDKHPLSAVMDAALFRDLSVSEFREIASAGQEHIFSHNQSLFSEGDPLRWVSIITSGHAKTIRHSAAGKPIILHICGPGDVLHGLGCSSRSTHSVEARAVRHCRVFSWDVGRFESLSSRFPLLGRNSIRLLLGH